MKSRLHVNRLRSAPYNISYDFTDTSFDKLMQKRIHRVLLVCSNYDAFILEEDGRIEEQIFNEYVSLNLRYPPMVIQADTPEKAFRILQEDQIDLVISALRIGDKDTFTLAKEMRAIKPDIPIVVLTYFSREVSKKIEEEDLSAIDYVFSWLGNADILLAIIKLIEDKMNAEDDILKVGVQTILFVEDSIRYISSYLPNLYRIILRQSKEYQIEGLNEHQRMLRMRGRPKILLATDLNEAMALFDKYKYNTLGVISDLSFKNDGVKDPQAGFKLLEYVRSFDPHMPFLLQSSDEGVKEKAEGLDAGFLHKYSKTLSKELKSFIIDNFAFGPFIFRDPDTLEEVDRAVNLREFQQKMMTIPDKILDYHTTRDHFSKWLNARALFSLAQMFKYLKREDFDTTEELRRFVYVAISSYRIGKGRGVIAKFNADSYDEYVIFSRIGDGSIGGKARGLAFINTVIKQNRLFNRFEGVQITIPRTVVVTTEIFDEFMESNDLYPFALSDREDEEILQHFVEARLPGKFREDLRAFLAITRNPVAVRSSSKLEDSHYQPFAGIYSTYMVPFIEDREKMLEAIDMAIKQVYASVYFRNSKAYMSATSNVIDEEKMGIVLQEVCGRAHGNLFYPTLSGVARSINFYPVPPEEPEEGIANVAFGLGKLIVDGEQSLRFSPRYPKKILQLSTVENALKETQRRFYALDLDMDHFVPSVNDAVNLLKLAIRQAPEDEALRWVASTYDLENNMIRDGIIDKGKRIITFANILQYERFPLAAILQELLAVGQKEMGNPIEIEFAADLETPEGHPRIFYFLQIRPIVDTDQVVRVDLGQVKPEETLLMSLSALGNGVVGDVADVIYVKPEAFDASFTKEIAADIEKRNAELQREGRGYILIGPGRWGSSDPWLGIPVKWPQISQARLIVEAGQEDYRVDPSQGTHFFQNLTSFRVGYFTVNPSEKKGFFDVDFLNARPALYEDRFIRHVRFDAPLLIRIDGRKKEGVVMKPEG